jgi:catechol 2,3-dioxygenase-like lactoylglutathione lyase family enzyme
MNAHLDLVTLIVREYDPAILFFTEVLGFELVRDEPSLTNDGRPKRWVEVRPPRGVTGLLLARADGPKQEAAIGEQMAGRVGWFLRVDDFNAAYQRLVEADVEFIGERRHESYGELAVFRDCEGNSWDLLGPPHVAPTAASA